MLLLAGGTAQAKIAVAAATSNATFDGTINLSDHPFFQGEAAFASPSLTRILQWLQTGLSTSSGLDAVNISGRIQGDRARIKFEDLKMTAAGSSGTGAAELLFEERGPVLSGTLALQQVDF